MGRGVLVRWRSLNLTKQGVVVVGKTNCVRRVVDISNNVVLFSGKCAGEEDGSQDESTGRPSSGSSCSRWEYDFKGWKSLRSAKGRWRPEDEYISEGYNSLSLNTSGLRTMRASYGVGPRVEVSAPSREYVHR